MENLALEQGLALQHFFPREFLESNALYTRQTQAINKRFMA